MVDPKRRRRKKRGKSRRGEQQKRKRVLGGKSNAIPGPAVVGFDDVIISRCSFRHVFVALSPLPLLLPFTRHSLSRRTIITHSCTLNTDRTIATTMASPVPVTRPVKTVLGVVDASQLGKTLPHEHMFIEFQCAHCEPHSLPITISHSASGPQAHSIASANDLPPVGDLSTLGWVRQNPYSYALNALHHPRTTSRR
jgi:hypothetical protein